MASVEKLKGTRRGRKRKVLTVYSPLVRALCVAYFLAKFRYNSAHMSLELKPVRWKKHPRKRKGRKKGFEDGSGGTAIIVRSP